MKRAPSAIRQEISINWISMCTRCCQTCRTNAECLHDADERPVCDRQQDRDWHF